MNDILSLNALSPNLFSSDCKLVSFENIFTAASCLSDICRRKQGNNKRFDLWIDLKHTCFAVPLLFYIFYSHIQEEDCAYNSASDVLPPCQRSCLWSLLIR